jgi:hypothetical protein
MNQLCRLLTHQAARNLFSAFYIVMFGLSFGAGAPVTFFFYFSGF